MDPSPYQVYPIERPVVTELQPDDRRRFLVLSGMRTRTGEPWTLLLELQEDYWISRRDLKTSLEPEAAVSGYLFDPEGLPDPVAVLRRMNELVRTEYYRILQEKMAGDQERNQLTLELARLRTRIEQLQQAQRRRFSPTSPAPSGGKSGSSRRRRPR
jgi:hypothetical protein